MLFAVIGFFLTTACTNLFEDDTSLESSDESNLTTLDPYTMQEGEPFPDYMPEFVEPISSPMIIEQGETIREIIHYGTDAATLQAQININRVIAPDELLCIHLQSRIIITDTPLTLHSKCILIFDSSSAGIIASDNIKASSLIKIENAENVGIMYNGDSGSEAVLLDGNNKAGITGIIAESCSKLHIDQISIANCQDAINFSGSSPTATNHAGVITRCTISNCSNMGVIASNTSQFVMTNTKFEQVQNCAAHIASNSMILHMNECDNCGDALTLLPPAEEQAPYGVISRNILTNNNSGITLSGSAYALLITENKILGNTIGMAIDGEYNRIFNNTFDNTTEITCATNSTNYVIRNDNLISAEIPSNLDGYFNPPTTDNPHTDEVMLNKSRRNLEIAQSGETPYDLAEVQSQLDEFRNYYPDDYIVLYLSGEFIAKGEHTGLEIPEYVSVLLDGEIYPEGEGMYSLTSDEHYLHDSDTGGTQMLLFNSSGYCSFSGGTIDCRGQLSPNEYCSLPAYGIYAPSSNVLLIDGVQIVGATDSNISLTGRSGVENISIVHNCQLEGCSASKRGLWSHSSDFVYCIGNESYNFASNFVDVDSDSKLTYMLFNFSFNSTQSSIYLEDNASQSVILGNYFNASAASTEAYGMETYNAQSSATLSRNMLLFNKTEGNMAGLKLQHTTDQFSFNNLTLSGEYIATESNQSLYSSCDIFNSGFTWQQSSSGGNYANTFFSLPF